MTVLVETTKVSPALAQFVDPSTPMAPSLFVAWTGTNAAHNLNVLGSFTGSGWHEACTARRWPIRARRCTWRGPARTSASILRRWA